jgi:hypothetical protein
MDGECGANGRGVAATDTAIHHTYVYTFVVLPVGTQSLPAVPAATAASARTVILIPPFKTSTFRWWGFVSWRRHLPMTAKIYIEGII